MPVRVQGLLLVLFGLLLLDPHDADAQTLRGSRASVDRIHRQALNHDLRFYQTPAAIRRGVAEGRLVRLGGNANYRVEGASYPYVLPATHTFVTRLAAQYRSACGERLVVTSAVRPQSLRLVNSSAKSVHPTGMAVDLRRSRRPRCLSWLRRTLLNLEAAGLLEAVEERNPPHFHVAVFPRQYQHYVQRRGGEVRVATGGTRAPAARSAARSAAPATTVYRVRAGDSLWGIARRHGTSVERLQQANNIRSEKIVVGQRLVIPVR